ncbi:MAG: glycosyltransferase family 2 protein [Actinomycetota bacterium]
MTGSSTETPSELAPSVLVVLVVRDAAGWLRGCLSALGAQTYPRMGVVAVDNASSDGSADLLTQALGERRVITSPQERGLAGSVQVALEIPAARDADYLLVLHDDTALDPDAVTRLVEAAIGMRVEDVGVVGPKVVDWDEPRLLRDVGRSADRFGHPYTPLQPGEIDQGQFDRVIEVLCVPTCAMLISRDAWQRTGLFDERLDTRHEDLDFCWRARLAGFRVLMTPLARARHRDASAAGERPKNHHRRSERYYEDRAAITVMLKNYGLLSLLWMLPLDLALGFLRLGYLVLTRRFEGAIDLLAAWGWNVVHLPGTLSRRMRAQSVRRVPDRQLRRFMESAGLRSPRWFAAAEQIFEEQREIDEQDEDATVGRRLRDRTASLVGSHPVLVASVLAAVVVTVAFRGLLGPESVHGGALAAFPDSWRGFFAELSSGYRTTGLGGSVAASPALGAMGAMSWLTFGSAAIAQKVLLGAGPILASIMLYRALARITGRPSAAVAGAAAYGLSALTLWSFSEGRIELLVTLSVLPAVTERLEVAFGSHDLPDGRWRFIAGVGVTIAVGVAFLPGIALAVCALMAVQLLFGSSRLRGIGIGLAASVAAAVLLFPFVPTVAAGGSAALGSRVGTTDLGALGRLALGGGPGTWPVAAFLPIAAVFAFALVGLEHRGVAGRAACTSVLGLALAWFSAAGYLPSWAANPPVYLALATVGEAMIVGLGLSSVLSRLGRESFGLRQIGTALLTIVLGGGLLLQSASAMVGGWSIGGPAALPPAWAVVSSSARGDFRVLWVGADTGARFVAPGGEPVGVTPNGASSLRYGLTGRAGVSALDTGRALTGGGATYLSRALEQILSGTTTHGGALLAPLGVRFVVAERGDLGADVTSILDAQVDLDREGTTGLVIYRNAQVLPPAGVIAADDAVARILDAADLGTIAQLPRLHGSPLPAVPGGWAGTSPSAGTVVVSTAFSADWRLEAPNGAAIRPREAFGWSTSFDAPAGVLRIRFTSQWVRTLEIVALGLLWLVALWITRKPVAR